MSTVAARRFFADALDCRHRLPMIWARVVSGEVRVDRAREVAKATRELAREAAAKVDAELCRLADGRVPSARFQRLLAGAVTAADPDLAARREAEENGREFARPGRSSEHGMRGFYLRSNVATIASFDATVGHLAQALKALGDDDTLDKRRTKACLIMANPLQAVELMAVFAASRAARDHGEPQPDAQPQPDSVVACDPTAFIRPRPFRPGSLGRELARLNGLLNGRGGCTPTGEATDGPTGRLKPFVFDWARLMPRAVLYVHTSRSGLEAGNAAVRVEGEGPVTTEWLRRHLGPRVRFQVKEVIDLARQTPVDAYEVPARHREAVALRTPVDCFPFGVTPARDSQVDHTKEYQPPDEGGPPGQSRPGNYGPLNGFHHRIKTSRRWTVRQPFDGIYVWRDPYGQIFLVDGSGTRQVTRPGTGRRRATSDVALQLFANDSVLEYSA